MIAEVRSEEEEEEETDSFVFGGCCGLTSDSPAAALPLLSFSCSSLLLRPLLSQRHCSLCGQVKS